MERLIWRRLSCVKGIMLNLIIEVRIISYKKRKKSNYRNNEMEIHEIPWPKEELLKLGDVKVEMKVTLSYFIEPSPGEVGWKDSGNNLGLKENVKMYIKTMHLSVEYNKKIIQEVILKIIK